MGANFEGRRKKKKCDLQRPICYRCRNSSSRSKCEWTTSGDEDSSRSFPHSSALTLPTAPSSCEGASISPASASTSYSADGGAEISPSLNEICKSAPVLKALEITPLLKADRLPHLLQEFESTVMDPGQRSEHSIALLSMLLAIRHPPMLHVWLACAGLPEVYKDPTLKTAFLTHYHLGVQGLAQALATKPFCSAEWMQPTVLGLHIFEEYQESIEVHQSRQHHIRGAHLIFQDSLSRRMPSSPLEILLLEAYIYRTAVNRLCDAEVELAFDYLEGPLRFLASSCQQRGTSIAEACPWIGTCGPDKMLYAFQLSWLAQCHPLSPEHRRRAEALAHNLEASEGQTPDINFKDPIELDRWKDIHRLARSTYWLACRLLSDTVLGLQQDRPWNSLAAEGLELTTQILDLTCPMPLLLWPVAILGTACPEDKRDDCRRLVARMKASFSCGTVARIEWLLISAWGTGRGAGVLLDRNHTKRLFF